uniref:Uncharacterized protein n=1 Tax=Arundo donax TaxID=35708 RepID=A0A0A9C8Q1_ARUDO
MPFKALNYLKASIPSLCQTHFSYSFVSNVLT